MPIRFRDSGPALKEEDMRAAEGRLGIVLPVEYRRFLLTQNGGVPRPNKFRFAHRRQNDDQLDDRTVQRLKVEIERFFSVGGKGRFSQMPFDLEAAQQSLADWSIPKHLLPIAAVDDEVSGGVLCVSLTADGGGHISYVVQDEDGECAVYPVADSLAALFNAMAKQKRKSPAWIQAIDDGDLEAVRRWLDEGGSSLFAAPPRTFFVMWTYSVSSSPSAPPSTARQVAIMLRCISWPVREPRKPCVCFLITGRAPPNGASPAN